LLLLALLLAAALACTITPASPGSGAPSPTASRLPGDIPTLELDPLPELPTPTLAVLATRTTTPSQTATPLASLPPTATPDPLACLPAGQPIQVGLVEWVQTGELLVANLQGTLQSVRLLGLDTPAETAPIVRGLLDGQVVRLVADGSADRDQYGALLRYALLLDDRFINYELLRQGVALVDAAQPGHACSSAFDQAAQAAFDESLGFWGEGIAFGASPTPSLTPWKPSTPTFTPPPSPTLIAGSPSPTLSPQPGATTTPVASATATTSGAPAPSATINPPSGEACACIAGLYSCDDFSTQAEAQICYDYCRALDLGDIHNLDSDGDGLACNSSTYP
jgi:endonuclease YncB( thermonuclease family)